MTAKLYSPPFRKHTYLLRQTESYREREFRQELILPKHFSYFYAINEVCDAGNTGIFRGFDWLIS